MNTKEVKSQEPVSELQMQLKEKLEVLKRQKGLKNNEIAVITGRSEGTVSDLLGSKKAFSENLIYSVMNKLGDYFQDGELVTTLRQYTKMWNIATACKKAADMRLVVGNTGIGKSVVFKKFAAENEYCYYLKIDRKLTWNKFLLAVNRAMGIEVQRKSSNALFDAVITKVEHISGHYPMLIIDESEVLDNAIFKGMKNLYTATEGLMGVLIVGITDVAKRLGKIAGLQVEYQRNIINFYPYRDDSNQYTTMVRRLNGFRIDNVEAGDIEEFCHTKGIVDKEVIKLAARKWWNFDVAARKMKRAVAMGINLGNMSVEEFELL